MQHLVLSRKEALASAKETYCADVVYDAVGRDAFKNNIKIREVKLPEVREVGSFAFSNCTALRGVEFPKVSVIREEAFSNCSNLREAKFPQEFLRLGTAAYLKCKRLYSADFTLSKKCIKIPDRAFEECKSLEDLALPVELQEVGERAFFKCESLERIKLPDTLKCIGDKGFYQCGFSELELPQGLEIIGESAFLKCKKLKYIKIPESVKKIGKWAFHGCGSLECLEIHHDPEFVGEWVTNKNCTIKCRQGTAMEKYAEKYEIRVEYL